MNEACRIIAELLNQSDRGHIEAEAFLEAHGWRFRAIDPGAPEGGYPGRWEPVEAVPSDEGS